MAITCYSCFLPSTPATPATPFSYAENNPPGTVAADFLELLMFGVPSPQLEMFLHKVVFLDPCLNFKLAPAGYDGERAEEAWTEHRAEL